MHIAILKENEDMVDYIGKNVRQTLKIGDNVSKLLQYCIFLSFLLSKNEKLIYRKREEI